MGLHEGCVGVGRYSVGNKYLLMLVRFRLIADNSHYKIDAQFSETRNKK